MAKTTPTPDSLSFLKARDRIPVYPLGLLLVHLLFALEWATTDSPSALPRTILFLAATLAIILLTDILVIRIGKPTSALDFLGQKWTASNTHLLAFVLVGGAMSVPPGGIWTDARAGSVGGVGFLLVMFAFGININNNDNYNDEARRAKKGREEQESPTVARDRSSGRSESPSGDKKR